jgi:hypothetical protein
MHVWKLAAFLLYLRFVVAPHAQYSPDNLSHNKCSFRTPAAFLRFLKTVLSHVVEVFRYCASCWNANGWLIISWLLTCRWTNSTWIGRLHWSDTPHCERSHAEDVSGYCRKFHGPHVVDQFHELVDSLWVRCSPIELHVACHGYCHSHGPPCWSIPHELADFMGQMLSPHCERFSCCMSALPSCFPWPLMLDQFHELFPTSWGQMLTTLWEVHVARQRYRSCSWPPCRWWIPHELVDFITCFSPHCERSHVACQSYCYVSWPPCRWSSTWIGRHGQMLSPHCERSHVWQVSVTFIHTSMSSINSTWIGRLHGVRCSPHYERFHVACQWLLSCHAPHVVDQFHMNCRLHNRCSHHIVRGFMLHVSGYCHASWPLHVDHSTWIGRLMGQMLYHIERFSCRMSVVTVMLWPLYLCRWSTPWIGRLHGSDVTTLWEVHVACQRHCHAMAPHVVDRPIWIGRLHGFRCSPHCESVHVACQWLAVMPNGPTRSIPHELVDFMWVRCSPHCERSLTCCMSVVTFMFHGPMSLINSTWMVDHGSDVSPHCERSHVAASKWLLSCYGPHKMLINSTWIGRLHGSDSLPHCERFSCCMSVVTVMLRPPCRWSIWPWIVDSYTVMLSPHCERVSALHVSGYCHVSLHVVDQFHMNCSTSCGSGCSPHCERSHAACQRYCHGPMSLINYELVDFRVRCSTHCERSHVACQRYFYTYLMSLITPHMNWSTSWFRCSPHCERFMLHVSEPSCSWPHVLINLATNWSTSWVDALTTL